MFMVKILMWGLVFFIGGDYIGKVLSEMRRQKKVDFTKVVGFTLPNEEKEYIGTAKVGQNRPHCVFFCRDTCQCDAAEWNETSKTCAFIKRISSIKNWQANSEITTIILIGMTGGNCDCEVSEWAEWGQCDAGTAQRNRSVIVEQSDDGLPCPPLEEQKTCADMNPMCDELGGFHYNVNDHCYVVPSSGGISWQAAYDDCIDRAPVGTWGRLAHVTDTNIYDGLYSLYSTYAGSIASVWVGVRHINGSNTDPNNWYWVNGATEPVTQLTWIKGSLDISSPSDECATYYSYNLHDFSCSSGFNFVCEFIPH